MESTLSLTVTPRQAPLPKHRRPGTQSANGFPGVALGRRAAGGHGCRACRRADWSQVVLRVVAEPLRSRRDARPLPVAAADSICERRGILLAGGLSGGGPVTANWTPVSVTSPRRRRATRSTATVSSSDSASRPRRRSPSSACFRCFQTAPHPRRGWRAAIGFSKSTGRVLNR